MNVGLGNIRKRPNSLDGPRQLQADTGFRYFGSVRGPKSRSHSELDSNRYVGSRVSRIAASYP